MSPEVFRAVDDGLALLPRQMDTPRARVMLMAMGLQESRFEHRRQLVGNPPKPTGPAKGWWQFEQGGGCKGVVTHEASRFWMHHVCQIRGVAFDPAAIWNALETDDVLAAAAARLLLFTDPRALPSIGDSEGAWQTYLRIWRPGKPHPQTWPEMYRRAREAVQELV